MAGISLGSSLFSSTGLSTGLGLSRGFGLFFGGFTIPAALDLNFATGVLDPRVTFSRPSQAMVTDSTGKLTYAPNNLLLYSERFDNAAWTKTASTVSADVIAAPDGTVTADKLVETATTGAHGLVQSTTVLTGSKSSFSLYVKAGERTAIFFQLDDGTSTNQVRCSFNLASGVTTAVTYVGAGANGTASIVSAGDGWYRLGLIGTPSTTATTARIGVYIQNPFANNSYAGDGTSGLFIWGAQLETVTYQTAPRPYVATTAAAYYGPRFDYDGVTLAANGLLIEEARTNVATYSSDYSNAAWTKRVGTAVLAAQTTAPDGTLTGFSMYDSAASAGTYIRQIPTLADNTVYTSSIYVKKQGLSSIRLICYAKSSTSDTASTTINFDTGVVTTTTTGTVSGAGGGATDVGNGWWRIWTSLNSSTGAVAIPFQLGSLNNPTGDGTSSVYVWGAQLEAGAFTTSHIPTGASAVIRALDSATMTGTNFSSWYNQSAGTFICQAKNYNSSATAAAMFSADVGSTSERIQVRRNGTNNVISVVVAAGAVISVNAGGGNVPLNTLAKVALGVKANDLSMYVNSAQVATSGSVVMPSPTRLAFGDGASISVWNGTIKSFTYYNTRLPNSTLQQLST